MLPDFLCIGAQKAGTSWLYYNIKRHPDVQMPPYKEIFYFNSPAVLPTITRILHPKNTGMRRRTWRVITYHLPRNRQHTRWFLRYLLLPRTDEWYASLFSRSEGQITGDITPTYARLGEARVAKVRALLPDAKVIYSLRNPIQRTWSQVAMYFSQWPYQGLGSVSSEQIKSFVERGSFRDSDYLRTLRIWESLYPQYQFHVVFFDELVQSPQTFFQDICNFLGLDAADRSIPQSVHKKRNVRRYSSIPEHHARHLASKYYDQIEELHRRFDNSYTADWLEFAKQYL